MQTTAAWQMRHREEPLCVSTSDVHVRKIILLHIFSSFRLCSLSLKKMHPSKFANLICDMDTF